MASGVIRFSDVAANGFEPVIPLCPLNAKVDPKGRIAKAGGFGKTPASYNEKTGLWWPLKEWQNLKPTRFDFAKWGGWRDQHRQRVNMGLLTSQFPTIDIDIEDARLAKKVQAAVEGVLGKTITRFRPNTGKRALVYRRRPGADPIYKKKVSYTDPFDGDGAVEVLGEGQQVHIFGDHKSGNPVQWAKNKSPATVKAARLPVVTNDQLNHALAEVLRVLEAEGVVIGRLKSGDRVQQGGEQDVVGSALAAPDPNLVVEWCQNHQNGLNGEDEIVDYHEFVNVSRAIKTSFGGDDGYYPHYEAWGLKWPDNTPEFLRNQWDAFDTSALGWDFLLEAHPAGRINVVDTMLDANEDPFESIEDIADLEETVERVSTAGGLHSRKGSIDGLRSADPGALRTVLAKFDDLKPWQRDAIVAGTDPIDAIAGAMRAGGDPKDLDTPWVRGALAQTSGIARDTALGTIKAACSGVRIDTLRELAKRGDREQRAAGGEIASRRLDPPKKEFDRHWQYGFWQRAMRKEGWFLVDRPSGLRAVRVVTEGDRRDPGTFKVNYQELTRSALIDRYSAFVICEPNGDDFNDPAAVKRLGEAWWDWAVANAGHKAAPGDPVGPPPKHYAGTGFYPPGAKLPKGAFNEWRGFAVDPDPAGDASLFYETLFRAVCGGDRVKFRWLLAWMAHAVQHPAQPPGTAPVLIGQGGTGKTEVAMKFASLFGDSRWMLTTDPEESVSGFMSQRSESIVVILDEMERKHWRDAESKLRSAITSTKATSRVKGAGQRNETFYNHFILISNEKNPFANSDDAMMRRAVPFNVADTFIKDTRHFAALDKQWRNGGAGRVLHDLLHLDIGKFEPHSGLVTGLSRSISQSAESPLIRMVMQRLDGDEALLQADRLGGDPWPDPKITDKKRAWRKMGSVRLSELRYEVELWERSRGYRITSTPSATALGRAIAKCGAFVVRTAMGQRTYTPLPRTLAMDEMRKRGFVFDGEEGDTAIDAGPNKSLPAYEVDLGVAEPEDPFDGLLDDVFDDPFDGLFDDPDDPFA